MNNLPTIPPEIIEELEQLRSWREPYRLLTQGQVEKEFGVSRNKIRTARRSGKLHCIKDGRRLLYAREDVRMWLRSMIGPVYDDVSVGPGTSRPPVSGEAIGRQAIEQMRQTARGATT